MSKQSCKPLREKKKSPLKPPDPIREINCFQPRSHLGERQAHSRIKANSWKVRLAFLAHILYTSILIFVDCCCSLLPPLLRLPSPPLPFASRPPKSCCPDLAIKCYLIRPETQCESWIITWLAFFHANKCTCTRTLSACQLLAAPEMRWRATGEVAAIFKFPDALSESMGREMRGLTESSGKKRVQVRNEIVLGHAMAILTPPKEGSS